MSIEKTSYTIIGYDFTKERDKILTEEFCDSEEYDDLICYQREGYVQLFHDPMQGEHLYFGYIIGGISDSEDDDKLVKVNIKNLINSQIIKTLHNQALKIANKNGFELPECELLIFAEYY